MALIKRLDMTGAVEESYSEARGKDGSESGDSSDSSVSEPRPQSPFDVEKEKSPWSPIRDHRNDVPEVKPQPPVDVEKEKSPRSPIRDHGNDVPEVKSQSPVDVEKEKFPRSPIRDHGNDVSEVKLRSPVVKKEGSFRRPVRNFLNRMPSLRKPIGRKNLPDLAKTLRRKDFKTIINILKDKDMTKDDLDPWFDKTYAYRGTLLHYVMPFKPPVELVRLIIFRFQNDFGIDHPQACVDSYKRTPSHLALKYNCDKEVVRAVTDLWSIFKSLQNRNKSS